jgi:multisubunit Na+/H+ antiporter MnhB subunit
VASRREYEPGRPASRAPRGGLQLMALIIAVMGLLAIYSNYQKIRRAQIEKVIVTPAASATPTISIGATPAAP